MRKYETWEVVKLLTENHNLKFQTSGWDMTYLTVIENKIALADKNGFWDVQERKASRFDVSNYLTLDNKWTLLQEPVSFIQAVESDRPVRVVHKEIKNFEDYISMPQLLSILVSAYSQHVVKNVILNGKWYIEGK